MRAREHWDKLEDMDTDSFMLVHWMREHSFRMFPPNYKFKVIGSYTDSLTRQISEAVFIEQKGKLNRKRSLELITYLDWRQINQAGNENRIYN